MRLITILILVFYQDTCLGQDSSVPYLKNCHSLIRREEDLLEYPMCCLHPRIIRRRHPSCKRVQLESLTNAEETWPLYCCNADGSVVEESCGDGIDCCNVCASYGGQSSNCVTFLNGEGDDPRAQAEEHCQQAQINPNYNCPNEDASNGQESTASSVSKLVDQCPSLIRKGSERDLVKYPFCCYHGLFRSDYNCRKFFGGRYKREAESNHTISKRNTNDFACGNSPALDTGHCPLRVTNKARMRVMECPCCLHQQTKENICGDQECPCD